MNPKREYFCGDGNCIEAIHIEYRGEFCATDGRIRVWHFYYDDAACYLGVVRRGNDAFRNLGYDDFVDDCGAEVEVYRVEQAFAYPAYFYGGVDRIGVCVAADGVRDSEYSAGHHADSGERLFYIFQQANQGKDDKTCAGGGGSGQWTDGRLFRYAVTAGGALFCKC